MHINDLPIPRPRPIDQRGLNSNIVDYCIYFFIPRFKCMKFIYSSFHPHQLAGDVTKHQFHYQLPVGLLAQLVRAMHRYRRGQGSSPDKPEFIKLSYTTAQVASFTATIFSSIQICLYSYQLFDM